MPATAEVGSAAAEMTATSEMTATPEMTAAPEMTATAEMTAAEMAAAPMPAAAAAVASTTSAKSGARQHRRQNDNGKPDTEFRHGALKPPCILNLRTGVRSKNAHMIIWFPCGGRPGSTQNDSREDTGCLEETRSALAADFLRKAITQADGSVEHRMTRSRIPIAREIALPLELHGVLRIGFRNRGLDPRVGKNFER
jgi:hypothetical protein